MPLYTKQSLELLRQKVDLVEVLSGHLQMHRSGAAFKALCPFHEEKTPSFIVQKGDTHYHCFGCGAHGDAIAFLMGHLKMSFIEAIESLADRFQVNLEREEKGESRKGPNKAELKSVLEYAHAFYHRFLLHTEEGHAALKYLYERGIDLNFVKQFEVGYAPPGDLLQPFLKGYGISPELMFETGLLSSRGRDFFADRITFPIRDAHGAVIGFSARKFKEETFGGKYINTPETPLFKKSHVLFGLSYSRQRIIKDRKAIVVEGQIDALRLIYSGFNYTVAGQGTAFGEDHAHELIQLGINHAFLALDGDTAGREAAVKIGHLFQKKGIEVSVLSLPEKSDPDSFIKEKGPEAFQKLLDSAQAYLPFLYSHLSKSLDLSSPSQKNELVESIVKRIQSWEHPVMKHESMKKLSEISQVPETLIRSDVVQPVVKRRDRLQIDQVDGDRILETDLIRWLYLAGETNERLVKMARLNVQENHLRVPVCRRLFSLYFEFITQQKKCDLFTLGIELQSDEEQAFLAELMDKKINLQRAEAGLSEAIRQILIRNWMEKGEAIRQKIQSGASSEEELLQLAKEFDEIKKQPPQVALPLN